MMMMMDEDGVIISFPSQTNPYNIIGELNAISSNNNDCNEGNNAEVINLNHFGLE